MTKTEMDIRSVLGPAGGSIRPLAAASDLFARRMFEERMDSEDIFLTKDIYPIVAVWLQKKPGATGRAIERLAARCWDLGDRGRLEGQRGGGAAGAGIGETGAGGARWGGKISGNRRPPGTL